MRKTGKQKGIIRSQLGYFKHLVWKKHATLTEANYTIDTALITSLLYKMQIVPHSEGEIDKIESSLVGMRKAAAKVARSSAHWPWYTPRQEGGLQLTRLRTRLTTLMTTRIITIMNGAAGAIMQNILAARIISDTIDKGEVAHPIFSPPTEKETGSNFVSYATATL